MCYERWNKIKMQILSDSSSYVFMLLLPNRNFFCLSPKHRAVILLSSYNEFIFNLCLRYKIGIFCRILSLRLKSCSLYRNSSCTQFLFVLYIIFFMYTNMCLLCYSAIGRTWKFWCIGSVFSFLMCYSLYFSFL